MTCPCRDCKDRHRGCHSHSCPHDYLLWKNEYDAHKKIVRRAKDSYVDYIGYAVDLDDKIKKSIRRK